jgi:hypothetical protein
MVVVAGALSLPAPQLACAQAPAVVAYYPAAPVLGYVPTRGPLGLRTVYRPIVSYPIAAAPVTALYAPVSPVVSAYYAPAVPVTTYYAPPVAVTSYYAPVAPVPAPAPVTVHYAPRPVVTYSVIVP